MRYIYNSSVVTTLCVCTTVISANYATPGTGNVYILLYIRIICNTPAELSLQHFEGFPFCQRGKPVCLV